MAKKIKKPPITVVFDGTSFIPSIGSHTQNIPPITSVKNKSVSSAAGITLDPIEYRIKPKQTKVPWTANKPWFRLEDKKDDWELIIIMDENTAQKIPANATVVNLGVSFLHLKVTENTENPSAEISPNTKPNKEPFSKSPIAIIKMPIVAIAIDIQTLVEILSFRNKKPNKAVINGIADKQRRVIAAVVWVIDQIKVIIAVPRPTPPITPEIPILR